MDAMSMKLRTGRPLTQQDVWKLLGKGVLWILAVVLVLCVMVLFMALALLWWGVKIMAKSAGIAMSAPLLPLWMTGVSQPVTVYPSKRG